MNINTTLTFPASVITQIPGIIGYYPHNDLIVLGFRDTDTDGTVAVGPITRCDIAHSDDTIDDMISPFTALTAALIVCVCDEEQLQDAKPACERAQEILESKNIPLLGGWHVTAIENRKKYVPLPDTWALHCSHEDSRKTGYLTHMKSQPSYLDHLFTTGRPPYACREDIAAHYAPAPDHTPFDDDYLAKIIDKAISIDCDTTRPPFTKLSHFHQGVDTTLHHLYRLDRMLESEKTDEDRELDATQRKILDYYLLHSMFSCHCRDTFIDFACHGEVAPIIADRSLALARRHPEKERSQLLIIHLVAQHAVGNGIDSYHTLRYILDNHSENQLAALFFESARAAYPGGLLGLCTQASAKFREEFTLPTPAFSTLVPPQADDYEEPSHPKGADKQ